MLIIKINGSICRIKISSSDPLNHPSQDVPFQKFPFFLDVEQPARKYIIGVLVFLPDRLSFGLREGRKGAFFFHFLVCLGKKFLFFRFFGFLESNVGVIHSSIPLATHAKNLLFFNYPKNHHQNHHVYDLYNAGSSK
jgi:hypothetical protein